MENIKRRIQLIIGLILILNVNSYSVEYIVVVSVECSERVEVSSTPLIIPPFMPSTRFYITKKAGYENHAIKLTTTEDAYDSITVNQLTGECWLYGARYNFMITADAVPSYVISVAADNGYTITQDPFGRVAVGENAQFTINRNPEYKNHTIEVAVNEPDKCGIISVDQVTGECTITNVQGDLEVSVKLIAPPPSVYHTVRLTVAPGIWCDYRPGDLVIEEGDHLFLQFHTEDPSLTADDILFLVDGVETAFKTSPDGTGGSYILNPVDKDHTLLIALRQYPVTLPAVDGAVTDPAAGVHKVPYGEPFRFTLSLNDRNDLEDLKVFANDTELSPIVETGHALSASPIGRENTRANALDRSDPQTGHALSLQYATDAVEGPIAIRIEGVNPTGNTPITTNSFNIYVSDGMLVAESPSATRLSVYTPAGQLYTARQIPAGTTRITLPQGIYFVQVGTEVHKVVID